MAHEMFKILADLAGTDDLEEVRKHFERSKSVNVLIDLIRDYRRGLVSEETIDNQARHLLRAMMANMLVFEHNNPDKSVVAWW